MPARQRAPTAPLAALLLASLGLAGCIAGGPPVQPTGAPVEEDRGPGLVPADEVANATQPEEPSEFARSLDEKFHAHNYWGASLEKLLMDDNVASTALFFADPANPFGTAMSLPFRVQGRGPGFTPFDLPEGSIVPPEAHRVEVTVTWADSPTITGLQLAYTTARDREFFLLEPFPKGGGTAAIPTSVEENDIPHTVISKWRFFLLPWSETGRGMFNGTAHVAVKAFRNDTLFVAPPHPDFWADATLLDLAHLGAPLKATRALVPVCRGEATEEACGVAFLRLPNGTIVPPHTGLLTVTLEWQNNATTPDPFGVRPELMFSASNSRFLRAPEGQSLEPGRSTYTIPVDAKMVDSPYANASEWRFVVYVTSDTPTEQDRGFGSVGSFDGHVTLSISAERERL